MKLGTSPHYTVTLNSLLLTVSTLVTKVLTFAYLFLIMRYLGPELYGKYALAYSFVAMLSFGSELGLSTFTIREVAADPSGARKLFSNMLTVRFFLALVTFGVIVGLGFVVTADSAARLAIVVFALAMILDALAEGFSGFFYAFQRMVYPAMGAIVRAGVVCGAVALFAHTGLGLGPIVGATAIGATAAVLILGVAFSFRHFVPRPSLHPDFVGAMLRNALPYAAMALITNIFFRIDVVMLSWMKGDLETGLYGAAYRIMESLLFISTAVNSAALPAMSRVLAATPLEVGGIFRSSLRWLLLAGLPMAVGLTVLAGPVMGLFGKGFAAAAPALQVLAWALVLMFVNHLSGTLLTAAGHQRMLVKICAVALAANVVLNLALIPRFGRMGAAWATLLCECGFMPALLLAARRYLNLYSLLPDLWRPCLGAAVMGFFCWHFAGVGLAILVPGGAVVYGIALGIMYAVGLVTRRVNSNQ